MTEKVNQVYNQPSKSNLFMYLSLSTEFAMVYQLTSTHFTSPFCLFIRLYEFHNRRDFANV